MSHAESILQIAAENAETNAPLRDDPEQAALDRAVAKDCRDAIAKLNG